MAFRLSDKFVSKFENEPPSWGFGDLSYFVYKRTYSRDMCVKCKTVDPHFFIKDGEELICRKCRYLGDSIKEEWFDTCRRVTEGVFEIQRRYCEQNKLPWQGHKAQKTAQEFFERMFTFKFLPPGRGLWVMGTPVVEKHGGASLNNCAFVSTEHITIDLAEPFCWTMDMLMLGVGVGFDTRGAGKVVIKKSTKAPIVFDIPDSREGWVEGLRLLLQSYQGGPPVIHNFDLIRPRGKPIRGFGGVASGPEPLRDLYEGIKLILDSLDGYTLNSVAITDIMNLIGKCVVSGNVRRSSEIALSELNDIDFLSMKDYTKYPVELKSHRWASNNSAFAFKDSKFSRVIPSIKINGEPGLVFIDNMRHFGRFKDGYAPFDNDRYDDCDGINPCITGDTRLHINGGLVKVEDLFRTQQTLECVVDNRTLNGYYGVTTRNATPVFKTSDSADVWRVTTKAGYQIKATAWHEFYTTRGKIQLKDLQIGDKLLIQSGKGLFGTMGSYELGFLLGIIAGDGHFKKDKGKKTLTVGLWGEEKRFSETICNYINSLVYGIIPRARKVNGCAVESRDEKRITSTSLATLANIYGFMRDTKLVIPEVVWNGTEECVRGYIHGLIESDSTINTTKTNCSIRTGSINKEFLREVQLLLSNWGIYSTIYLRRKAGYHLLPDSKRNLKEYYCQDFYELAIDSQSRKIFLETIGFTDKGSKYNKCYQWTQTRRTYKQKFTTPIETIEYVGKESVYDTTQNDKNSVIFNGIVTGQCSEQMLKSYELCTLVETFPARHQNAADYHETLKYAFLYAKTITLIPTHCEKTNQVMMRNRRIGCSMSGVQQAIKKFGKYTFFNEFCDKGYDTIRSWDRIYSRWLGIPRSIRMTTVKPSGTVSLLAGATPGVHWTHAEYYLRTVRMAANSPLLYPLYLSGYRIEIANTSNAKLQEILGALVNEEQKDIETIYTITHEGLAWANKSHRGNISFQLDTLLKLLSSKDITMVVYFPVKETDFTKNKAAVSLWEQLNIIREMQYYWSDNGVSCTLTFKKTEEDDIEPAIEYFAPYVKALSFLPLEDHGYSQAPYTTCSKEEYDTYARSLARLDFTFLTTSIPQGEKFCTNDSCSI